MSGAEDGRDCCICWSCCGVNDCASARATISPETRNRKASLPKERPITVFSMSRALGWISEYARPGGGVASELCKCEVKNIFRRWKKLNKPRHISRATGIATASSGVRRAFQTRRRQQRKWSVMIRRLVPSRLLHLFLPKSVRNPHYVGIIFSLTGTPEAALVRQLRGRGYDRTRIPLLLLVFDQAQRQQRTNTARLKYIFNEAPRGRDVAAGVSREYECSADR